jgi:fructokinase
VVDSKCIVGIGEILWDVFPDGPRFGGAPSNFACSLAELAKESADVFMVSAVGDDELGQRAVDALQRHGVDTSHLQISQRPTGQVLVELDAAGVASYRFAQNCAWDQLDWNDGLQNLSARCDAVCFGTLGQRDQHARHTIQRFVAAMPPDSLRILDVNLRPPFFDDAVILESLQQANVLKLNDDELPRLAALLRAAGSETDILRQLAEAFQLRAVALTRGANGAVIVSGQQVSDLPGIPLTLADTVGAGDAFTAAMTLGLLAGRSIEQVNRLASDAASFVCTVKGATTSFPRELIDRHSRA